MAMKTYRFYYKLLSLPWDQQITIVDQDFYSREEVEYEVEDPAYLLLGLIAVEEKV